MAGIPARFAIMSRLGPEDQLKAVPLSGNSGAFYTAGNDWAIVRGDASTSSSASASASSSSSAASPPTADLYYKDVVEAERLQAVVEGPGAAARVLRDLASARHVCAQPRFAFELCRGSFRAHQLKQCTPAYVEKLKCEVKLARAVDILLLNRGDWRDHLLPAGNLREPRSAIGRARVIAT